MRSRSTRPMSLRRTLPLASVRAVAARRPATHRSCPAPSATTMTACARSSSRRSRRAQEAALAVEPQRHLGDEHEVGVGRRQRRVAGDEARVAPHQLDQPDAVARAVRLDVRAADGLDRGRERALEAEAAVDEVDVVVDGLGDADDRDRAACAARSRRRSWSRPAASRRRRSRTARRCPAPRGCRPSRAGSWPPRERPEHRPALVVDRRSPGRARGAAARARSVRPSPRSRSESRGSSFTP